ncbi:MAG: cytochrome b N-terminal domain-containing protein [Acidobacteriota bacterium]|nr:cytochrome b N-terminal domain-containing protein [Acidobacteriota bacterium]
MGLFSKKSLWEKLVWPWAPASDREAGSGIVSNFLLHGFPNRISLKSFAFGYSFYLGTISFVLFMILTVTGIVLMFLYIPSVERAYWSIKDLEFAVSFGWLLRRVHRLSAHLMVAVVFLHMFRVFLTGAYKAGSVVKSARPYNWVLGVVLLVLTLLLSFTGYLLPWDQLAFWAITVGTNIAASVPLIGEEMREFLLGGTIIGQPTLIRFYVLHCVFLPLILFGITGWHMWRVRKDGGLAIVDTVRRDARETEPAQPKKSKTYSILGIAAGTTVQVSDPTTLNKDNSLPATPHMTTRLLWVTLLTVAVTLALALFIPAPLEGPANPEVTPNPAKAPWYFLGLQELVGYSALMGGVIIPGIVVMGLALIPFMDREQRSIGTWFTDRPGRRWAYFGFLYGALVTCLCVASSILFPVRSVFSGFESQLFFDLVNPATLLVALCAVLYFVVARVTKSTRHAAIATFCAFIIAFILLTYIGTALRGPNWEFYWPWQAWPEHPGRI